MRMLILILATLTALALSIYDGPDPRCLQTMTQGEVCPIVTDDPEPVGVIMDDGSPF